MIRSITITPKFTVTEKDIWDMIDYDDGSTIGVAEHINELMDHVHELKMAIVHMQMDDIKQEETKKKTKQKKVNNKNVTSENWSK